MITLAHFFNVRNAELVCVSRSFHCSKHIPGAQYVNVLNAEHDAIFPRALPDADTFTDMARRAGVSDQSHVIVYSKSDRAGYFLSGRGWWTFKVTFPHVAYCFAAYQRY